MDATEYLWDTPFPQALDAIDRYDGSQDPSMWLDSIQELADLYNWPADTCLKVGKLKLTGSAKSWARCHQFADWDDFQQQLDSRYGETKAAAVSRLEHCWQRSNESVKDFADRYLQDAEKAGRAEDDTMVYNFTQRLLPELKIEVARQRLDSIQEIVTFCKFWADMSAPPEESSLYIGASATNRGTCGFTRAPRSGPPRPKPYKPPCHDNTNQPLSTTLFDWKLPSQPQTSVTAHPSKAAIDELTQRFYCLEHSVLQHLQDQERECRTLRCALRKQQEQQSGLDQFNFFDEAIPEAVDLAWLNADDYEDNLDHELLASLLVTPQDATHHQSPFEEPQAFTQTLTVLDGHIAVLPFSSTTHDAGEWLNAKTEKMVADVFHSTSSDDVQEASLAPQDALLNLSNLAGGQPLTHLDHDMSHRVEPSLHGMRLTLKPPSDALYMMDSPRHSPGTCSHRFSYPQVAPVVPKVSTCKVIAKINGRKVDCVVDASTNSTAITLDCLRHLKMDSVFDPMQPCYLSADDYNNTGKDKIPVMLSLGGLNTIIHPAVTSAHKYDVLIGNDVLSRARATIDYNKGKLAIQVDPTCTQEVDISLTCPDKMFLNMKSMQKNNEGHMASYHAHSAAPMVAVAPATTPSNTSSIAATGHPTDPNSRPKLLPADRGINADSADTMSLYSLSKSELHDSTSEAKSDDDKENLSPHSMHTLLAFIQQAYPPSTPNWSPQPGSPVSDGQLLPVGPQSCSAQGTRKLAMKTNDTGQQSSADNP